jgi:3-methylfumaryl-CoA hydratase
VSLKEGRTGPLVFVLVCHEISNDEGVALTEEHDIVYRNKPKADDPAPTPQVGPGDATWTREICPDEVLLFRYSALTFNAYRIHFDRRYVTEVEGYPGLVVHGPLIATLLLDLVRRSLPEAAVAKFSFRAVKPLFDIAPFSICGRAEGDGKTVKLWAKDAENWLAMEATATLA